VLLCCSGTIAVELALRALGVGPGDEVALAGYDFPGNFRAIEATGARPLLVDIAAGDWSLDCEQVAEALRAGARVVIASHLHGALADMPRLRALADEYGAKIVEDVCQAPGATIAGRPAGAWGDVGVFSFGGSKLLTAGRGGALITGDAVALQRAKIFSERGNQAFPLSELAAALLIPQWERLDEDNARRQVAVDLLRGALGRETSLCPVHNRLPGARPSYYKLGFLFDSRSALPPDSFTASEGAPAKADVVGAASATANQGATGGDGCEDRLAQLVAQAQARGVALDRGFRGFVNRGPRRCSRLGPLENSRRASVASLVLHHPILLEPPERVITTAHALRSVALQFR
jgi:hypothetical protein